MFNRGSSKACRNAKKLPPPPYNRGSRGFRSNAMQSTPPPYFGATSRPQKCHLLVAPMGRVIKATQQCRSAVTLPNHLTGGQTRLAEMPPIIHPRLTTGSHGNLAEMPLLRRSRFIWCRVRLAEMPQHWRTNNQRPIHQHRNVNYASPRTKQGDPLWINVTKTQPLPRYI